MFFCLSLPATIEYGLHINICWAWTWCRPHYHLVADAENSQRVSSSVYLRDRILAGTIDDVVQRPLASHIVDADELEQGRVDEAHADTVPHVHGRQIGHDRQSTSETVGRGEKIQHCRHTWPEDRSGTTGQEEMGMWPGNRIRSRGNEGRKKQEHVSQFQLQ